MARHWVFESQSGRFVIAEMDDRFVVFFDGDALGSYATAEQALGDLVGGQTTWPSIGDPSQLDLPEELAEWDCFDAPA